jgi:heme exporter protein B
MKIIYQLLKHEFLLQNKIYNLTKYFWIFFIFCSSSITIVNSYDNINNFGIIFSVIAIPLALIGITSNFLRPELEDGSLELLLASFRPTQIILAKYLSLFMCGSIGFIINLPFSYLLFNIDANQLILIGTCGLLLMLTSSAIIALISSIQCYFRSNTNFLSILIMPLIIPNIILSGIIIQSDSNYSMILILLGVNFIIVPICIFLSSYLIENIYNI